MINMASVVAECLRYRNLAREWSEMQSAVSSYEERISADQKQLAEAKESMTLVPHLMEGDRIVGFGGRDLTRLKRAEAAQVLHRWMVDWRAGAALEQVQALRENRPLTVYLQFPEDTKELLLLLRSPLLQIEPLPDLGPAPVEPAPPPPPAPSTDPVTRSIEIIAADVIPQFLAISDVILEMRRRTEPYKTGTAPTRPKDVAPALARIDDPLVFKPDELSTAAALEIGEWWSALPKEERIRFARWFGLWCAYARQQAPKK